MRKRIKRKFFTRPTLRVAKELLGKYLVRDLPEGSQEIGRKIGGYTLTPMHRCEGKIVETEAYMGPQDRASHSFGGKVTARNQAEYLKGGHIYIYLIYGMYWQLNITTSSAGKPECVLIRALEPEEGNYKLANGPGKLCRWLKLDKSFYGEDLTKSSRIWVEDRGLKVNYSLIRANKRIGIDYAGPVWANKPWRFYLKNNPAVSRK